MELGFTGTLKEIKEIRRNEYKNWVNKKIREKAFNYLLGKQRSKGKEINYREFHMAEYLLPNDVFKDVEDQRYLFAIRNRMIDIPINFGNQSKCFCGEKETMSHIYNYRKMNENQERIEFEKVFNEKLPEQEQIFKEFRNNMKIRENNTHVIDNNQSTNLCTDISNGNT